MSVEVLQACAADWADIVANVEPFGGTELLARSRSIAVQAWFDYELLPTACLTALQAIETTFRQLLFPEAKARTTFRHLVDRAESDGVISPDKAGSIRAGVKLRNSLSHPEGGCAFTLGMADSMIRISHVVVRDICEVRGMVGQARPT